jgi:hypothetical protein
MAPLKTARLSEAPAAMSSQMPRLSAVKYVVAKVLHLQDSGIGPSGQRLVEMRLDHLADDDVVIALFDNSRDAAFDRPHCVDQKRRPGRAAAERLAAELAIADIGGPEECKRHGFLFLAEHVEGESLRGFHRLVSTRIGFDSDHHQRRREGALRDPIHGGCREAAFRVRREDINSITKRPNVS